jgi:flagellin
MAKVPVTLTGSLTAPIYSGKSTSVQRSSQAEQAQSIVNKQPQQNEKSPVQISEPMRFHVKTMSKNAEKLQDNITKMQTADQGLQTTEKALKKMKELAVKASDESLSTDDRKALQAELKKMSVVIDKVSDKTKFDDKKLLNGGYSENIQTGASKNHTSKVKIANMDSKSVGVDILDISSKDGAKEATAAIDDALKKVNDQRKHVNDVQAKMLKTVSIQSSVISKLADTPEKATNREDAREVLDKLIEQVTKNNQLNVNNMLKMNNNQAFNLLYGAPLYK